jgi:hypothetical protein
VGYTVTYGEGGYDPLLPNNNIVAVIDEATMTVLTYDQMLAFLSDPEHPDISSRA